MRKPRYRKEGRKKYGCKERCNDNCCCKVRFESLNYEYPVTVNQLQFT